MPARRVAVAAPGPMEVDAARVVAEAGGNAVDAAIAAMLVATVTEPGIVSPMGGAYVNVGTPDGQAVVVDGNVEMPGRGRPAEAFGSGVRECRIDYFGGLTMFGGHGSVATPGMFAAFDEASRRWGRLPWAVLVEPAIVAARDGYPLGSSAAFYLQLTGHTLFGADPASRAFVTQGDGSLVAGSTMRDADLAATLETIARDGVASLYAGELARVVAADMDAHGGLLGLEDLRSYRAAVRPALRSSLGRWEIATNPPPSIGGPVLTAMAQLLGALHAETGRTDPEDVIEVERLVLGYRRHAVDRADDLETAGVELLRLLAELGPDGLAAVCSSPETAHVSAVDEDGLACAITCSAGYGSGVTTPGTGLMLNNALGEPELNRRGLHALPPGTRLASNMAPTTARHDAGATLAIGTPGADRITTALLQVLGGICLDGLGLADAIDRPRVHIAFDDEGQPRVEYEAGDALDAAARASGLPRVPHGRFAMYFGGVAATARHDDGRLEAAADPRRESAAEVV